MAITLTQAVANPGTTAATATVAKPATGALMALWLLATTGSGHISAVSVTDNGSNTGWTLVGPVQASGTNDMFMAYRIATSTDHSSMTTVTWNFTGTTTLTETEFDEFATGFAGTPTLDPGAAYKATPATTSPENIQALNAGTSIKSSGELSLFGITWTATNGGFTSWTTSGNPPWASAASTAPSGTAATTRIDIAWATSTGSFTTTDHQSVAWVTNRANAVIGISFYDPGGSNTFGILEAF